MTDRVAYWLDLCEYDLDTAKAMLETKRYLYVGFMCHQVVEKALKAYFSAVQSNEPPKIHSLIRLAQISGLNKQMSEDQLDTLSDFMPLNIEARYPSDKKRLIKSLNEKKCESIITKTEEIYQWIQRQLKKL